MKQHTLSYKNNIKEMGRELSVKITYGNITLDNEAINSVNPRYQGALLKSVMKELEIDSNVVIPKGTEINFKFGISLDNSPIEYLDFGNYIVKDIEKQEDTNSYLIKCYDKMLYSMDDYKSLGITYPCTIRAYINALCTKLNLNFKNKSDTFINYDKLIPNELYLDAEGKDIGYKYRDVFDELAQVTASTICLDINDNVEIRYINDTNDTIDEEYLKDVNVNFGEKFGPINSVVLSRNGEDNIYRKDDLSVQNNGLYEIKITDNQIMNFNNRDKYIDNIFNKLKGIEYYLNDFSSTGITYYDLLDKYSVKIENKTYNCIMFNDNIEINQGLVENINTEKPEESQTDYSKADKTDRRINQTYRIVDKQNQTIKELITKTDGNTKQILQIDKSLEGVNTKLSQTTAKTEKLDKDLANTNQTIATNQANFEDFKTNEYMQSIGNLQDQIDGAIQFWNGAEIPTLNNYPANQWKTENDRINHTADIYTVIKDVNGQMKQGKGYRFDKVGGTWQWVELTDNELSAVQAIADEANKRSKANSNSIKTLEDKNVQVDLTLDGIKTEVSNNTTEIKQITETSKSVTGTNNLSLDNALASNVLDYNVEGNKIQDGVPSPDYPQEVECVKGYNLIKKEKVITNSFINYEYVNDISNTLHFSYISNKDLTTVVLYLKYNYKGTPKIIDIGNGNVKANTRKVISFNLTSEQVKEIKNSTNLEVQIYSYGNNDLTTYKISNVMLSTEPKPYLPYNNIGVKDTGKNLFNVNNLINGFISDKGNVGVNEAWRITNYYIKINNKYNYTFSWKSSSDFQVRIALFDKNKKFIKVLNVYEYGKSKIFNFENADYIKISYSISVSGQLVERKDIQLEKGTQVTPYEPYKETQTNIDLQGNELCKIGETKDLLHIDSNGKTTIEKRFAKYVFTGDEDWRAWSGYFYYRYITEQFNFNTYIPFIQYVSNYFTFNANLDTTTDNNWMRVIKIRERDNIEFQIKIDKFNNDINTFKQVLKDKYNSGNPVYVIYELETPQTIELADTNITLFDGVNNLSLLANIETNTSCNYLLKTPLSKDYATNQRVDNTDKQVDNLDNNVKTNTYKIETNTKSLTNLSQEVNNIHASVTDIQTTTIQSIDGVAKNVETLTKKVDAKMTSEEVDLAIKKELENGTTKVKTETGYTFDSEGLKIAKEGEEMNSQFDNTGMYVKRDNEFILKANHDGVDATNLHAKTYLIIGKNSRFEDFERDGESRTACFWIGGNS